MARWFIEQSIITDVTDNLAVFAPPDNSSNDAEGLMTIPFSAAQKPVDVVIGSETYTALIGKSLLIPLAAIARNNPDIQKSIVVDTDAACDVRLELRVRSHTFMNRTDGRMSGERVSDRCGLPITIADACSIVVDDGATSIEVDVPDHVGFGVLAVPESVVEECGSMPINPEPFLFDYPIAIIVHPARHKNQTHDEMIVETFYALRMMVNALTPSAHDVVIGWDAESGDDVILSGEAIAQSVYAIPLHFPAVMRAYARLGMSMTMSIRDRLGVMDVIAAARSAGAWAIRIDDGMAIIDFDDGALRVITL